MNSKKLIQKSIDIITEYYRNQLDPFFSYISDDVLWIGPRQGQLIKGKKNIIQVWTAAAEHPRFSMGAISVQSISTGRNNLEVLLEYNVYTYFPNGETNKHHQRLHFSWGYRHINDDGREKILPRICMIHISNVISDLGNQSKVYASSLSESTADSYQDKLPPISSRTIYVQGADGISYYLNLADIIWIESADSGRHSIIHALDNTYKSIERLRSIENQYGDVLLRCHTSYLINPAFVQSVKRFTVTMTDHSELPVPEKKYTAFRKLLAEKTDA